MLACNVGPGNTTSSFPSPLPSPLLATPPPPSGVLPQLQGLHTILWCLELGRDLHPQHSPCLQQVATCCLNQLQCQHVEVGMGTLLTWPRPPFAARLGSAFWTGRWLAGMRRRRATCEGHQGTATPSDLPQVVHVMCLCPPPGQKETTWM